jgi:hypothetical protein
MLNEQARIGGLANSPMPKSTISSNRSELPQSSGQGLGAPNQDALFSGERLDQRGIDSE